MSSRGDLTASEDLRFFEYLLPECRMEAAVRHDLNPPAQKILYID